MKSWNLGQSAVAICALVTILSYESSFTAYAEGGDKRPGGDNGVNRRVVTNFGYSEVSGAVTMKFGGIPTGLNQPTKDSNNDPCFPVVPTLGVKPSDWAFVGDSPTYYLGGNGRYIKNQNGLSSNVEVDGGLQYDLALNTRFPNDPAPQPRGWWFFFRNTNWETAPPCPQTGAQNSYNSLQYFDLRDKASHLWDTYIFRGDVQYAPDKTDCGIDGANLKFKIYEHDDPATPTVERPGWISLTFNKADYIAYNNKPDYAATNQAQAQLLAGSQTIYWNGSKPAAPLQPVLPTVVTTVAFDTPSGPSLIVRDAAGVAVGDNIQVDGEPVKRITAITNNGDGTSAISAVDDATGNQTFAAHGAGTVVTESLLAKTTVAAHVSVGDTTITLANAAGIDKDTRINIGSTTYQVSAYPNGNIVSIKEAQGFAEEHNLNDLVTWKQDLRFAYLNHPVAPWYGIPVFDPAHMIDYDQNQKPVAGWRVKRVIGMTRNSGWKSELDGSWITSSLSGGAVKKVGLDQIAQDWVSSDVKQEDKGFTGYDAPSNETGDMLWDQRVKPTPPILPGHFEGLRDPARSKTIVEFPNLDIVNIAARYGDGTKGTTDAKNNTSYSAKYQGTQLSRYTREDVNINLRGGVAPKTWQTKVRKKGSSVPAVIPQP